MFEGEWGKADGYARQAHLVRVNAWRQRQKAKGLMPSSGRASGSTKPNLPQDTLEASGSKANTATLEAIRDDPKALRSDRIQAVRLLAQLEGGKASSDRDEVVVWMQREKTLQLIDPPQRLAWLLGELREDEGEGAPAPLEGEGDARVPVASSVGAGGHPRAE